MWVLGGGVGRAQPVTGRCEVFTSLLPEYQLSGALLASFGAPC